MYAAHLAQKARELKREKRKSDTLLFQMLPPSVAEQLRQTQQVHFAILCPFLLVDAKSIDFNFLSGAC